MERLVNVKKYLFFTRISANESIRVLPPGLVQVERLKEDEEHSGEKGGQEGVEDDIEQDNLGCKRKICIR